MGRVYNALVKAGRFDERGRPIGRPMGPRPVRRPGAAAPTPSTRPAQQRTPRVDEPLNAPFTAGSLVVEGINTNSSNGFAPERYPSFGEQAFPESPSLAEIFAEPAQTSSLVGDAAPAPQEAEVGLSDLEAEIKKMWPLAGTPKSNKSLLSLEACAVARISNLASGHQLAALGGLDELAREKYYTLAARVLNLAARRKIKTILVTSADQGEGKTTVAANLAAVIGRMPDRRVLLLDADARRPGVEKALGLRLKRGWPDVIEGKARPEECAVRIEGSNLYVMGNPRVEAERAVDAMEGRKAQDAGIAAVELLSFSGTGRLLGNLGDVFDFVIIDAPPITQFGETQRLASMADASIMVVKAERTGREEVTTALKLIPKERRLGVVLNESQIDEDNAYSVSKSRSFFGSLLGGKKSRRRAS